MHILSDITELRALIQSWRKNGERIAFVPTMGNLHQGHLRLIDIARRHADRVVASIFVNPMQFGRHEDLDKYPRTLEADCAGLTEHKADAVFTPTPELMYPRGLDAQTYIEVPALGDLHCGQSRPGHFRGVATIVCKLLNLVQPDIACFGQKDYQQLAVIRQMVLDLSIPVDIIGVATERADDGLALSSRNGYLSAQQRQIAPVLYQQLQWLKQQLQDGTGDYRTLEQHVATALEQAGFKTDYIHICNQLDLTLANDDSVARVILAAAYLGHTRLIDNLEI